MAEEDHQESEVSQEQVVPQESTVFPPSVAPKTSWPELVGLAAEVAERKIKEEMPAVRIQVVPPDCFVTTDFNEQRVRLYIDSSQNVVSPPMIG